MARLQISSPEETYQDGREDAHGVITELSNCAPEDASQHLFNSLSAVVYLAIHERNEEGSTRLSAWCDLIAPMLHEACNPEPEQDEVAALRERNLAMSEKCALFAAALKRADDEVIEINRQHQAANDLIDTAVLLSHMIDDGRILILSPGELERKVINQLKREVLALYPRTGSK
ncbi:MAG: hypothetical protein PHV02_16065 [Rhodocyclaceae bacterium]|nr:hypothetical protein [Rhodocyclaceae bacterium]